MSGCTNGREANQTQFTNKNLTSGSGSGNHCYIYLAKPKSSSGGILQNAECQMPNAKCSLCLGFSSFTHNCLQFMAP